MQRKFKFKIGDRVRVIEAGNCLDVGDTGTITSFRHWWEGMVGYGIDFGGKKTDWGTREDVLELANPILFQCVAHAACPKKKCLDAHPHTENGLCHRSEGCVSVSIPASFCVPVVKESGIWVEVMPYSKQKWAVVGRALGRDSKPFYCFGHERPVLFESQCEANVEKDELAKHFGYSYTYKVVAANSLQDLYDMGVKEYDKD